MSVIMSTTSINSVTELLAHPSLYPFLVYFQRSDYDDLDMLLEMNEDNWDRVLLTVEGEAAVDNISMSPGVRDRILLRLRREKVRRESQSGVVSAGSPTTGVKNDAMMGVNDDLISTQGRRSSLVVDVSHLPDESGITKSYVFFNGFSCFDVHWGFCLGLCILVLCISLFLLLLNELNGTSGESSEDGESGGWRFLFVAMILGFCLSGTFLVFAMCAYFRNPHGDVNISCQDSVLVAAIASLCMSFSLCLQDISLPQCCAADPNATTSWCPSCAITSCECGGWDVPRCTTEHFCPNCDNLYCPEMPDMGGISCDCCPDCHNFKSCFYTTYKIVCCQCQIQV